MPDYVRRLLLLSIRITLYLNNTVSTSHPLYYYKCFYFTLFETKHPLQN